MILTNPVGVWLPLVALRNAPYALDWSESILLLSFGKEIQRISAFRTDLT